MSGILGAISVTGEAGEGEGMIVIRAMQGRCRGVSRDLAVTLLSRIRRFLLGNFDATGVVGVCVAFAAASRSRLEAWSRMDCPVLRIIGSLVLECLLGGYPYLLRGLVLVLFGVVSVNLA